MADYSAAMQQILSGKVNNPYLDQMATGIKNTVNDNLTQNVLPGIGSDAMMAGGYGGSRQGIAQGLAIGQSNKYLGDSLANLYGGQQSQANQLQAQMTGQLSGQDATAANLATSLAAQKAMNDANLGLGYLNANQNFYTSNRGLDLQSLQTGANLFGAGANGSQGIGQNLTNIGNQQNQQPWNQLGNFSNNVNQYTGLGGSTNQTNSQGGGLTGAIGGALAGTQLYNNLGFGGSPAPAQPVRTPIGMGSIRGAYGV
jgi:hypothetical protein